jgi:hypothetical protein
VLRLAQGDVAFLLTEDAAARARIERLATDAVRQMEEARGGRVVAVSPHRCAWDITSYPPVVGGRQPETRHIGVKGRVQGAGSVTATRNEMLYALNQADEFALAIALVGDDDAVEGAWNIHGPFDQEPGWGVASSNFHLQALLERGEQQC